MISKIEKCGNESNLISEETNNSILNAINNKRKVKIIGKLKNRLSKIEEEDPTCTHQLTSL